MFRTLLAVAATCVLATSARADKAAAEACAAKLPTEAMAIYRDTAPAMTASVDLRTVITDHTKKLVMAGQVAQGTARDSAVAAGKCLASLQ